MAAPATKARNTRKLAASNGRAPFRTPARPVTEIILVTPDIAEDWLGRNSHNRTLRNSQVTFLAGAITRGEWKLNGDAIRWSSDGVLLDGQHRLWAIIEADTPVETMVTWGLDPETQETMDAGARRSLKDALQLRGIPSAIAMAAAVTYWWRYQNGAVRYGNTRPSVAQGVAVFDNNPGLREAMSEAGRLRGRYRVSQAMATAAIYEFQAIDPDAAGVFVDKLFSGIGLEEGSPILALRRWLERQSISGAGARASTVVTHALFIKAWNAYRDGRSVDQLNWKAAGMHAEAFPEAH